jgi:DNA repair exonuclease SbcCD ATPase subunit
MTGENSWESHSRLVLKELETLALAIGQLRDEFSSLKQEIALVQAREDKVSELTKWKERIDEVASPSQLQELKAEVEQLKLFKTKAITIFMVVQFGMGVVLALMSMV